MIVVGSGIVNTCCCFFSAVVVVVVVVTRQCGESSWHASTHCWLHMQPCQPNDCSSKRAVGLNHKRTAMVAVLHSEAHAAATSLPMHSRRNGIAWDLVLHYALHYAPDMHDASTPLTPTNYSMVQRICSVPLLEPKSSAISDLLVALKGFHASEYVAFLLGRERQSNVDVRPTVSTTTTKRAREEEGSSTIASSHHQHDLLPIPEDATYGFVSECHPFVGMARTALSIAQGTLAAVECIAPPLLEHAAPAWCAIHWWGGRHHAHAERASGFCFLNDVVVGVQQLQQRLRANRHIGRKPRVLVVDIDAHHGDGTQEAFFTTTPRCSHCRPIGWASVSTPVPVSAPSVVRGLAAVRPATYRCLRVVVAALQPRWLWVALTRRGRRSAPTPLLLFAAPTRCKATRWVV